MNVRKSLLAVAVSIGCLLGTGLSTASAATAEVQPTVKPICGIHYKLTQDLNGRWYCKYSPERRHNRHDRERRNSN